MVVVLVVASASAARVTSQQQEPQEQAGVQTLIQQYDLARRRIDRIDKKIHPNKAEKCNLNTARQYAVNKRLATWGWQDKIYVPRTRTNYAEKDTRACGYLKWIGKTWSKRAVQHWKLYNKLQDPTKAICHIFGRYCGQALAVASCESHLYVWAHNGQYLGMFQMGSSERRIFGHGNTPLEQAYAAHKYFIASGSDWSPWSCKP